MGERESERERERERETERRNNADGGQGVEVNNEAHSTERRQ